MTMGYFCLGGLDLLQKLDAVVSADQRRAYIDWVYAQQLDGAHGGGFRGSPAAEQGHLTMTYTALLTLAILRDDFQRLDRGGIKTHVQKMQQKDGRYDSCLMQFFMYPRLGGTGCAIYVLRIRDCLLAERLEHGGRGSRSGQCLTVPAL